jgi:hypothetical protein
MGKLIELVTGKTAVPALLGPQVQERLTAAEARLVELEGRYAALALEDTLGKAPAGDRLAALEKMLAAARRDVEQFRAAHALALQKDALAGIEGHAKTQEQQLATMERCSAERQAAMREVFKGCELVSNGYQRYLTATVAMAAAQPAGTKLPEVSLGPNGVYGSTLGGIERLIMAEFFRHWTVDRTPPSWARPPDDSYRLQPTAIEPGADVLRRGDEFTLAAIRSQIEAGRQSTRDLIA